MAVQEFESKSARASFSLFSLHREKSPTLLVVVSKVSSYPSDVASDPGSDGRDGQEDREVENSRAEEGSEESADVRGFNQSEERVKSELTW